MDDYDGYDPDDPKHPGYVGQLTTTSDDLRKARRENPTTEETKE